MKLPNGIKMTPMLKQYTEWKDKYPDCLLLFRMGDFFEMFFDDAVEASSLLDITLTARDQDRAIPMAGVPHHALDSYLAKLIKAGRRVAICDQTTEPDGRTLVERRVVKVITPGTYTPQTAEGDGRLAAISISDDRLAVALLTPGTAFLRAGTLRIDEALTALSTFEPDEILVPKGRVDQIRSALPASSRYLFEDERIVERERQDFHTDTSYQWLCRRWEIAGLSGMGLEDGDPAIGACAAALRYLDETQFTQAAHIHEVTPLLPSGSLMMDRSTHINLELVGDGSPSLLSVLDRCRTQAGRRMLKDWILRPCSDLQEISFRHDCVAAFLGSVQSIADLAAALSSFKDIERAVSRLSLGSGSPRDLGAVRDALTAIPKIKDIVTSIGSPELSRLAADIPDMGDLSSMLDASLEDELPRSIAAGGIVRDGYDAALDDARDAIKNAQLNIAEFERDERDRTGIKLKVGINKVFGYYIEVGKNYLDKVPDDYVRRQTVSNGERYVNERLHAIERRYQRAEGMIAQREREIYDGLTANVIKESRRCQEASRAVSKIDALRSLAEVARDNRYVRPVMDESRIFSVIGGRHPVVELHSGAEAFTPNDICLDPDASDGKGCIAIMTGPNMAGKSTYLRTAAIIAVMAHIGSYVPAESATIGLIDRIFTRLGARDDIAKGRSTFMVEMLETANILRNVTPRSLVILDEIGRGTSTYDGMSIAWAVVEFLSANVRGRTKALFATHYHELTDLSLDSLVNLSMAVEETKSGIRFLHKVVHAPADRSYGVEVAKLAGVPDLVVQRAQEILLMLERERGDSRAKISDMSSRYSRQEIFFDVDREGIIEELSQCDVDRMTPLDALSLVSKLRKKSRKILGLK